MGEYRHILFVVLDWGLGHATRSIPIIRELNNQSFKVTIGSAGDALSLLKKEFPNTECIDFPSYNIKYYSPNMLFNIGIQFPKICWTVIQEHFKIRSILKKKKIHAIISDNRFGCFPPGKKVFSIFMTHQINLLIPNPVLQEVARYFNRFIINRYHICWIPDFEDGFRLAGSLSEPTGVKNFRFIGPLSRMKPITNSKKYEVLAILSGPEPMRTYFQNLLIQQLIQLNIKVLLVEGKPGSQSPNEKVIAPFFKVQSYMNSNALQEAISQSRFIISRSGYSSLMDLFTLGKQALLVPTPGQTEQEYLAEQHANSPFFIVQQQDKLDINKALQELALLNPDKIHRSDPGQLLKAALDELTFKIYS